MPPWLAVPITRAPSATASCTAIRPTPPVAPWTRTVWPAPTPVTASACAAVTPVSIIPLASSNDSGDGLGITLDRGTVTSSAYPPSIRYAITSSPTRTGPPGPSAPSATSVTTPAAPNPSRIGSRAGSRPMAPLYSL